MISETKLGFIVTCSTCDLAPLHTLTRSQAERAEARHRCPNQPTGAAA